jgi:hypothetical protein
VARLSGYTVTATREASWAGVPALEMSARWRYDGRAIHQQQAHLALGDAWLYLAISTPIEGRAAADAWFDRLRDTIRFRLPA